MHPRWENYSKVWNAGNIDVYFLNSLWITVVATVLTVVLGSLVTYAITRMKWKGSSFVLGLFMVAMMIPVHSTLIPLFSFFNKVGLTRITSYNVCYTKLLRESWSPGHYQFETFASAQEAMDWLQSNEAVLV